jgi:nucleotide-binding universal stress UspA family protein
MSILCATDFSPSAKAAADVAALLAKKLKIPLHLVHCAHDYVVVGDLPVVVPDDRVVLDQLQTEAKRLEVASTAVTKELRRGPASQEILSAAKEQSAEMIVVGSSGLGAASWLLGSVAEEVAQKSPAPTLVVRRPEVLLSWLGDEATLETLLGVDLAESSDAAIDWIKKLAGAGPLKVGAAHVHPANDATETPEIHLARERDVWDKVHAVLGDMPLTVHVREASGRNSRYFLDLAQERGAGMIVVGSHRRRGWQRFATPSFSRRVLAYAESNVLCVPAIKDPARMSIPITQRVLVAADLISQTNDLLRHAQSLITDHGAIRLVHVCHEPDRGVNPLIASEVYFDHSLATAKAREEAAQKIHALPKALVDIEGVRFSSEIVTHHDIAGAVCSSAERFGADVICMGTKAHSRVASALLGSTVQGVLSRSHKPVFVITPPAV